MANAMQRGNAIFNAGTLKFIIIEKFLVNIRSMNEKLIPQSGRYFFKCSTKD
jgi:hypothetical protein